MTVWRPWRGTILIKTFKLVGREREEAERRKSSEEEGLGVGDAFTSGSLSSWASSKAIWWVYQENKYVE